MVTLGLTNTTQYCKIKPYKAQHNTKENKTIDKPRPFTFKNNHADACGTPPEYDENEYFVELGENKYGEQILCVRNKETGQFHFHHGDCGWEAIYSIDNPLINGWSSLPPFLSDDEVEFIQTAYYDFEFVKLEPPFSRRRWLNV